MSSAGDEVDVNNHLDKKGNRLKPEPHDTDISVEASKISKGGYDDSSEGETILDGQVTISGKEKHMQLKSNGLKIAACKVNLKKDKPEVLFLPWRDVISVAKDSKSSHQPNSSFIIHYIQNRSNCILRLTSLKIEDAGGHAEKWVSVIQDQYNKVRGRPHKLFVLINPIGGAGRARQIYHKSVAPIFELAQIATTVVATERSKHALEIGETHDFSSYDGIVIVGGDGLYQELLQGFTVQTQKKAGVNYHSPDTKFVPPPIPIGIIPAGTGNGVSRWINGTIDFETSALNIVRGEHHRGQIFTVHSDDKFICVSALVFGYGMFSDMIKRTDELRWMKRARYPYAAVVTLFKKKRLFKCELTYCVSDEKTSHINNSTEDVNSDGDTLSGNQKEEWLTYTKSNHTYCGIFSFTCDTIVNGDSLVLNPFGTHVQLGIDTGCGQIALLKNLLKFSSGKKTSSTTPENLDFISNVTAFKIKLLRDEESEDHLTGAQAQSRELEKLLDIDGEVVCLEKPEMDVRLHVSFVPLYGKAKVIKTE
ncbi:ceramide kinase 1-like [Physella acuta]|uniref:ceramide kinase 1-like n=1 Tax=Physella acuta TaxID=109671 RepID=UPI0027DE607A|nr:ceramide kinase 1-like [Physella acuta]XP_059155285.1 ceramide kinase 1-like [Physella acuta]